MRPGSNSKGIDMIGTFVQERLCKLALGFSVLGLSACNVAQVDDELGVTTAPIVDVPHTAVQRQSIGNCWIYSHATWVESMHLASTGDEINLSQSYWTYWNWFDQISGTLSRSEGDVEVTTGGTWATANGIVRRYGLMEEVDFVPEDMVSEMSQRQASALTRINRSLQTGALSTLTARGNRALVRAELNAAWQLAPDVVSDLDGVFGATVSRTFDGYGSARATASNSAVVPASTFPVAYVSRRTPSRSQPESFVPVNTTLTTAMRDWRVANYSRGNRGFLQRMQRALHERQPVILTWDVDSNAQDFRATPLRGAFTLQTLLAAGGPGPQGGHMVVLEDYEAVTAFGVLSAGVTLDPNIPLDRAKLAAALRSDTEIKFLRIKNSWGTVRADRGSVPGFPGYHDLYMDYLNGPIAWCPDEDRRAPGFSCTGQTVPLRHVILPPGF